MKKYVTIIAYSLFQAITCFGQVFTGVCTKDAGDNAEVIALERAKDNALIAELGEDVYSFSILERNGENETYYKKTRSKTNGVVFVRNKHVKETEDEVIVVIKAEVYSVEKPKTIEVKQIHQVSAEDGGKYQYTENIPLVLEVTSHTKNYLNVFWFDEVTCEGGLLFSDVLTKGQNKTYNSCNYWKTIFTELMTPDDRLNYMFRHNGVVIPERKRTGGKRHIRIEFVATQEETVMPNNVKDENTYEEWWSNIPCFLRQVPVVEHLTFLM